jgi:8-oxo-dGTP pyrophosphatase MutT (NUDIX family)
MVDLDAEPNTPVHPAATVMLLRDTAEGPEVFMLRRTTSAAFARGAYVFPGGRVDDTDSATELEPYCRGLDDAAASDTLGLDAGGLAFWVAAVRECFEEAGVLLGSRRSGAPLDLTNGERDDVHDGALSMAELCSRHDLELDVGDVLYVAHWVTPRGESRRFDTRFFLAAAPVDQDPLHDDSETIASRWYRPADALAAMNAREVMLMPPTIAMLEMLGQHQTTAEAIDSARRAGPPPRIEPRLRLRPDGKFAGVSLPGDPDYDALA